MNILGLALVDAQIGMYDNLVGASVSLRKVTKQKLDDWPLSTNVLHLEVNIYRMNHR